MNFEQLKKESILHEYENIRLRNKRLLQDRQEEVYAKIPEIQKLQRESKLSYIELMKERLSSQNTEHARTDAVSSKNRENASRVQELLLYHGYPADYLSPIYDCPVCQDQGYVNGEACACFQRKIVDALHKQSNMTQVLDRENFDTFRLDYYSQNISPNLKQTTSPYDNARNVLQRCKAFVANFEKQSRDRGNLLLYGETGLGKTFLTNCIAKELLEKGHTVLYLSANDIFEQVFGEYLMNKKNELEELYKYIYNSELLIIDDLGTETTNSFVCSKLFEVINQRGLTGRSTVISTNLSVRELQEKYSERIMSRIVESYTVLHLYGENIRYKKRKEMIQGSKL